MASSSSQAVVWGAGGFVGAELLRLVLGHPHLKLAAALSDTHRDRPLGDLLPGLAPCTALRFQSEREWDWDQLARGHWTIFACLPHQQSMHKLPPVLEKVADWEARVIDLSGDFRLQDTRIYQRYYGVEHAAPDWLHKFVYGLPELNRGRIVNSRWVSNPGCLATGAQLAVLPLAAAGFEIEFAALDGKTGSSGAGVMARPTTHHPLRYNNFRAYKVGTHQHLPEIIAGWRAAGGNRETEISFVPQMAPMVRGIFTTAHFLLRNAVPPGRVEEAYADFYRDAPMIRRVQASPAVAEVWGSNRCDLSVHSQGRRIVVCTAIDNLIKGAAGQAIQNANLIHGWDEGAGLRTPAPWPV